jgi:hypothetical protein
MPETNGAALVDLTIKVSKALHEIVSNFAGVADITAQEWYESWLRADFKELLEKFSALHADTKRLANVR